MAFGSLLALLDDISTVLDDVSLMTKVAAKKTVGVVGDDLAINAQQVTGSSADREIPVVLAVMKGSFVNKLILVPAALLIAAFAPKLLTILLMFGGTYLCFEGLEKILDALHRKRCPERHAKSASDTSDTSDNDKQEPPEKCLTEKERIRGAIRTDFILSAEIITIALGSMSGKTLPVQAVALAIVAVLMTLGVYGLVAGIVKLDDLGFWLMRKEASTFSAFAKAFGKGLIAATPWLMRGLGIVGTAAMFLVGGGIIVHGLHGIHALPAISTMEGWLQHLHHFADVRPVWAGQALGLLGNAAIGVLVGAIAVAAVKTVVATGNLLRRRR